MPKARRNYRVFQAYAQKCLRAGNSDNIRLSGSAETEAWSQRRSLRSLMDERRVGDMTETTRKILLPTRESANWRCSDCAWSQPFVQRFEVIPNVPTKAIEDAFNRHKCTEHRPPKWNK